MLSEDKALIKRIMEELWPEVRSYILRRSGSLEDSKDIFQEGLASLVRKIQQGELPKDKWRAYLMGACKNQWGKLCRDRKGKFLSIEFWVENFPDETKQSPEFKAFYQSIPQLVREKIAELGSNCQEVLKLRHFENWSIAMIAEEVNQKVGYTRLLIHRCKERLEKLMRQDSRFSDFH
ncbi:MAG: sigma-70 family RNA polymerase sigma factor [Bacteroidota bacterium]